MIVRNWGEGGRGLGGRGLGGRGGGRGEAMGESEVKEERG